MGKVVKILPIPGNHVPGAQTIENSLAEKNWKFLPGVTKGFAPLKTQGNRYLTGIDPEADYIERIVNPDDREKERAIVQARFDRLEKATGLRGRLAALPTVTGEGKELETYYSGTYGQNYGTTLVAQKVKLGNTGKVYNFSDPFAELEFWWVIQNKTLIAPSLEAVRNGKHPNAMFYVDNEQEQEVAAYKTNIAVAKAVKKLSEMSIEKQKKLVRLVGLPVSTDDKDEVLFNRLYEWINSKDVKIGKYVGNDPIEVFNRISNMSDDLFNAEDLVERAIKYRVYSVRTGGMIYEGSTMIAVSRDKLLHQLTSTKEGKEAQLALEIKVDDKVKLKP